MHQWEGPDPAVFQMNHLLCRLPNGCHVLEDVAARATRSRLQSTTGAKIHLRRLKQPLLPTELSFLCQRANCGQVSNL